MPPKTAAAPKSTVLPPAARPMPEERPIPASAFQRYPQNRTPKDDAVLEMVNSIKEVGQLQPITARPIGRASAESPEEFEIIFGETRWLACLKIHPDFPVRCYVLDIDDKEAAKIHAIENFQRRDLDEIEEARSMKNMIEHGWTIEDIMNHLGRAKDHVYKRLQILKLDEKAHEAIREKNLSLHTAVLIASLPEEMRADALTACLSPKYQDSPLSERQALNHINSEFVEPLKLAKSWEDQRKALEEEHPGATWLAYQEAHVYARQNSREIEPAEDTPDSSYLTDAAAAKSEAHQQIELPTWGELSRKHSTPRFIAFKLYSKEPAVYVVTRPVIDAERAADPESFFADPDAVEGEGEDDGDQSAFAAEKERRKALETAIEGERLKMIEHVMSGGSMSKSALKKFAESSLWSLIEETCLSDDQLKLIFPVGNVGGYDEDMEAIRAEIAKLFKPKDANPLEIFARVGLATQVAMGSVFSGAKFEYSLAALVFETGAFKRTDYPALSERFPVPAKVEEQPAPEAPAATVE